MNLNGRLSFTGNVHGSMGASLVANVEANPAESPSQTLVSIRVGDVIYSIPSGGGGGVTSYSLLTDKPKINNHTIDGDMTSADLDLQDKIVFPEDGSKYLDGNGSFSTPAIPLVNYSTNEQVIGSWIDGKPLYSKTIECGTLPDNSTKYVQTLDNTWRVVCMTGVAISSLDPSSVRPLPFPADSSNNIRIDVTSGILRIMTYAAWSSYNGYITLYYTKTTD